MNSIFRICILRIQWRFSTILKTSNKSVWCNVFLICKSMYILRKYSIHYINTIHWAKTQMLKKFPSDKRNGTKNAIFFSFASSTHRSLIFNLWFFYELKHKVRLSKTLCRIFHFRSRFVFIKVHIFVQQNAWTLGHHNSFQN